MKLYLQRHGEAEAGERNDPTRGLTEQGREQVKLMGEFLVRQIGRVDLVVSSNFKRAFDTARGMADLLGCEIVETSPALDPDGTPRIAWSDVEILTGACCPETADAHVLVVSHHPLIGELAEYLCGVKTSDEKFHHAAVMHIHGSGPGSVMEYFVPPRLVERDEATVIEAAAAADLIETAALVIAALIDSDDVEFREGWVTIDGAHVFIDDTGTITKGPAALLGKMHHGPVESMSKSEIAKATYSGGLKAHQDLGDKTATEVGEALGMPVTPNNKAFDVENKKYGIEVKTLVTQKNDKITMNSYARSLKAKRETEAGLKAFTVVVDKRPAGLGSSTGATRYFVSHGYGSFRIGSMTEVKSLGAAKTFIRGGE